MIIDCQLKSLLKNYLKTLIVGFGQADALGLSIKFSLVFPSFVYLFATKPLVKQSKASGQSSGGVWVENRAEI